MMLSEKCCYSVSAVAKIKLKGKKVKSDSRFIFLCTFIVWCIFGLHRSILECSTVKKRRIYCARYEQCADMLQIKKELLGSKWNKNVRRKSVSLISKHMSQKS